MVHPRKISFTEIRGSSRICNNKVVSDFKFGHFLKKTYLVLPSLNNFFSQKGTPRIWMKLVSHTLFAVVSCPYTFLGLLFKKLRPVSSPLCISIKVNLLRNMPNIYIGLIIFLITKNPFC